MKFTFTDFDTLCMRRALSLARQAQGRVEPNPMVGAVVAASGRIVSEGFHRAFGGPHAEIWALQKAAKRAVGGTLYVTLEPCCHWGKTPPCTDSVLRSGVTRVVVAMADPFPKVHGKGIVILRHAGVRVDVGLLEAEARTLNAPFITRITKHRPFIIAKWAQSLDGRIASNPGQPRWISSEPSRAWVHTLRSRVDGILIGINTALADDPLLTARPKRRISHRIPTRIVLDAHCRLPPDSKLVRSVSEAPVLLVHAAALPPAATKRLRNLEARGVMMHAVPALREGGNLHLPTFLKHLARLDYTNLLVEGGAQVLAAFFEQDLVDEAHIFMAPKLIGGNAPVIWPALKAVNSRENLKFHSAVPSGSDMHLTLRRG